MKITGLRMPIALLAVMVFLIFSSMVFAHTLSVTVRDAAGNAITDGTTSYSPKQTCSGCHIGAKTGWLTTQKRDCGVGSNELCATDYEYGTGTVTKYTANKSATGTWVESFFDVTVPLHGASVGKHSTEGRNEGLTIGQRNTWGAPKNITSPGMSGRF